MDTFYTFTMTPTVHAAASVKEHKKFLNAALKRIVRGTANQYVWVREHQANDSVHWHVFSDGWKDHSILPGVEDKHESVN